MALRREEIKALNPEFGVFNKEIKKAKLNSIIGLDESPVVGFVEISEYFNIDTNLLRVWRSNGVPYPRIPEVSKKLGISEGVLVDDGYAIKKWNRLNKK